MISEIHQLKPDLDSW